MPKTSLNASLHGLVKLAITCVHTYMVVTVTVTKIYGKMSFNRWALAITAVPKTLTSRIPTTGYARVLLFIMYNARARRNGYRMFISVYILWYLLFELHPESYSIPAMSKGEWTPHMYGCFHECLHYKPI